MWPNSDIPLAPLGVAAVCVMLAAPLVGFIRSGARIWRRAPFVSRLALATFFAAAIRYGGAKNGATNEPERVSNPAALCDDGMSSPRSGGDGCWTNSALRIDALSFTDDSVVLPVSWTPGLLASGSVLSVWGTPDALTNAFFEMSAQVVCADGLTNAVLSAPFTNALHSQAFFSVRSNADADGDGLCDYVESVVFGSNPHSADTNGDGFSDLAKWRLGMDPTSAPSEVVGHFPNLSSVMVCPSFGLSSTNGLAEAFYSRTFNVGRQTPFRQFFLSSSPTGSVPVVFYDMQLVYRDSSGFSGRVYASYPCGIRLQLSTNEISSVTVEMHATGDFPCIMDPLYLIAYEPELSIEGLSGTCTVSDGVTAGLLVGKSRVAFSLDRSRRPSNLPLAEEEVDALDFMQLSGGVRMVDMDGQMRGAPRTRSPYSPGLEFPGAGLYGLPGGKNVLVILPSVSYGVSHGYCGTGVEWNGECHFVKSAYPLDSKCLWENWTRGDGIAYGCSCSPVLYAGIDTVAYPFVTTSLWSDDSSVTGCVYVSGHEVWRGGATHDVDEGGTDSAALDGDGCCSEGCAGGNCDEYEGDGLGSVRFRIPLGLTAKDRIAGFLWFERNRPFSVSPGSFSLLVRPDATATDATEGGVRRVVCSDARGRTLCVSNIAAGVGIAITDTHGGTPVHSWEVTNPSAASIRFRKISKAGNVMSDRTYVFANGAWSRVDGISGDESTVSATGDLYEDGYVGEERTVRCAGRVAERVVTRRSLVGWDETAVLRETYRAELGADGAWKESFADYWDDWESSQRHGQLRFVWGDDRTWRYMDYDDSGRETLRIEQRDGSPAPYEWYDWTADDLPDEKSFVTVFGYAPLSGDSNDFRDRERARCETRYVSECGAKTLVGRTWRRYVRGTSGGLPTVTVTTMRAGSPSAGPNDAGNAVSTETRYADDAGSVPLILRGALVSSVDEDGIAAANTYSLAGGVLFCTSRKVYASRPLPTYETTEMDATYGNVLRRTTWLTDGDAIIADDRMVYDDQNRLRSTTHLDGTSETNAYSCCRLLWSRDATGARTLRSAMTGTDHLYYAEEQVGVRDLPRNTEIWDGYWSEQQFEQAYPVVQHFFDSLGRETNTVRRSAMAEGEAVSPSFPHRGGYVVSETRDYPQGVSDVEVRVDGRGLRTERVVRHGQECETTVEEEYEPGMSSPSVVVTNIAVRGGGTLEWRTKAGLGVPAAPSAWICTRRFSEYLADGRRVDYAVTESSGYGIVTNSISTYDFLGRIVSSSSPCVATTPSSSAFATTAYLYDGTSSRILLSTCTADDVVRTTQYVYDDFGERVGETVDGVTSRVDVAYETDSSNVAWRVEMSMQTGGGATNSVSQTRTRLTVLSDALRSEVVEIRDGAEISHSTAAWDADASALTQVVWSAASGLSWAKFVHDREVESVSPQGRVVTYFSPLGLPFYRKRSPPGGSGLHRWEASFVDGVGDVLGRGQFYGPQLSTFKYWEQWHDYRGNVISMEDEAGNVVTNVVDADGRVVAEGGATYPTEAGYDTQGRRVALRTTRGGDAWDETHWAFDAATGLCTNRVYADGSSVAYTHTPDGLPLRTTYASGRWRENSYDARRNLSGVAYSDPSLDFAVASDAFGRATNVTGAAGGEWRYEYGRGDAVVREEIAAQAATAAKFSRAYDAIYRPAGLALSVNGVAKGGVGYAYGDDGLLSQVVATNSAGRVLTVAYSNLSARCYGYVVTTPGGAAIHRVAARNNYRRDLLNSCTTTFNGATLDSHTYTYDVLSRPTARTSGGVASTFAYNERSEVVSAQIGTSHFAHAYDYIGNQTLFAENTLTNIYTHNSLNQIATSLRAAAPLREICHDLDGNLTNDCVFAYAYDAANRLASVSSAALTNGAIRVVNAYDYRNRRTRKTVQRYADGGWQTTEFRTFVYDNWDLIHETVSTVSGATTNTTEIQYFWGMDLSETLQSAGGVGGLLAVSINGLFYFPSYDNNGNVTKYIDEGGSVVAAYEYDDFGRMISQSGPMAEDFRIRFSTKYFDSETGLYYYGYRFYSPSLMRWLNRDPIGERGGLNLYLAVANSPVLFIDALGFYRLIYHKFGTPPQGGWKREIDAAFKATFRFPQVFMLGYPQGKIGYRVDFHPQESVFEIFLRESFTFDAINDELDHVNCAIIYDTALGVFKDEVEKIIACPNVAQQKYDAAKSKLQAAEKKCKQCNDALDAKDGPHGH